MVSANMTLPFQAEAIVSISVAKLSKLERTKIVGVPPVELVR